MARVAGQPAEHGLQSPSTESALELAIEKHDCCSTRTLNADRRGNALTPFDVGAEVQTATPSNSEGALHEPAAGIADSGDGLS